MITTCLVKIILSYIIFTISACLLAFSTGSRQEFQRLNEILGIDTYKFNSFCTFEGYLLHFSPLTDNIIAEKSGKSLKI